MNLQEKAQRIDEKYRAFNFISDQLEGGHGRLEGYVVTVKDNICVKGMRSSAGSKILENYSPPFDATVVSKARSEGAIILGKTTMDEFGFGTFNVNTQFNIPLNPHDLERSTGGSSGGAAVVTAVADFPHLAIAESTGGSISCPASFCGVVGITPTYGRTSRWGLIDYANSLDKVGCMGKNVREAALMLSVISGPDEYDSTVIRSGTPNYLEYTNRTLEGFKVGVPREYFGEGIDTEVSDNVWRGIKKLESKGSDIEEVSMPFTKHSLSSYYIVAMAEASTNLAKLCGLRYGLELPLEENFDDYFSKVRTEGFGEEAKRRILLGTYTRMAGYRDAYYLKALKVRTRVIEDFKRVFKYVDVLAAPTMPIVAPRFDDISKLEPHQHYMMDILTAAPNLAGIPMVSVPCGEINGLPVGIHIMADHLQEIKMLTAAANVEEI
jgi:aspartyl-tRNA(Asn)/glutamyl-tRNA(Gln) amidotransferase subunit A